MTKIKFTQFYDTLGKKEIKDFKKFADSNYFNNGRDFNEILSMIDRIKHKDLNSRDFVKSLADGLNAGTRTIWNRLHELMVIAERYMATKGIEEHKLQFDNMILRYYLSNSAYNLFGQKYKASIKAFDKIKKGTETFYHIYEVLQCGGYYNIYNNQSDHYAQNLTGQVTYHSASFMINHYLHLTELLQLRSLTSKELSQKGLNFLTDNDVEKFLIILKEEHEDLFNIVSFHYYIYKAFLNKKEDTYYSNAKECFQKVYNIINSNYKAAFYQILINYCIDRTNMQDKEYYKELFDLYNRKLEDGLYQDLQVGNFPINNFRDYIFVAQQLGKIDWIRWFIEKYSRELPANIRKDEVNLSYGIVHYHESDHKKALEFLNSVAGDNYLHYMDSKYYKLRLFYETQQFEEALMETDNYKHYMRAHKEIPDTFKRTYKLFISEYSQLLNIRLKENPEEAVLLKRDLSNKPQSSRRTWIIRKLDEFLAVG